MIANTFQELGLVERSEVLHRQVLELDVPFGRRGVVATSQAALGQFESMRGNFDLAIALLEQSLATRESMGPEHSGAVGKGHNAICDLATNFGRWELAETHCQRAIEVLDQAFADRKPGVEATDVANARDSYGGYFRVRGRLDKALALKEEAFQSVESELGPEHPMTAVFRNNLATVLFDLGRVEEAIDLMRTSLRAIESSLGPESPRTALALSNLGAFLSNLGRYEEAIELLERAVDLRLELYGEDSPQTAWSVSNLAWALLETGELDRAEHLFEQATTIRERTLGPDHPDVTQSLVGLGWTYSDRGQYQKALPLFERCAQIVAVSHGTESTRYASYLSSVASTHIELENWAAAEEALAKTVEIRQPRDGRAADRDYGKNLDQWALATRRLGDDEGAARIEARAAAFRAKSDLETADDADSAEGSGG